MIVSKGVSKRGNSFVARYWNKRLCRAVYVGSFRTKLEAEFAIIEHRRKINEMPAENLVLPKRKRKPRHIIFEPTISKWTCMGCGKEYDCKAEPKQCVCGSIAFKDV